MEHFVTTVALVGIVIVVASLLSSAVERSGVPLVAVFLALGAVLGPWGLGVAVVDLGSPTLEVLADLGLAVLLFSDAVSLDTREIRAQWGLVWRLLGPGTLLSAVIIAAAARLLLGVPLPAAAILGAALASTDPVLLRSTVRSPALPPTTRVALRLESGMNDAVLLPIVVISMLVLRNAMPGVEVAPSEVTRSVLGLLVLGPALGALVGWVGITMLVQVRSRIGVRRDYESLYALGLAFTGYAAAEAVGGSGFLAAFAAGIVVSAQDVELCDCFLEYGEATAEMLLLLTFVAFGTAPIWTGLSAIEPRTLLFAVVALLARTAVLFPILARTGVAARDRRLIALFGPRGLSSLLLALLPVFAGLPGAEYLFRITCLAVLLSVVVHGSGIAAFLRVAAARQSALESPAPATPMPAPAALSAPDGGGPAAPEPDRITLDELRALQARGQPVVIVDARADRSYRKDDARAAGAVRLPPEDPVRTATERKLAHNATLVVYCA